jgi:polysaccharide deacetylase 2 family uncharacterized protein YibQ
MAAVSYALWLGGMLLVSGGTFVWERAAKVEKHVRKAGDEIGRFVSGAQTVADNSSRSVRNPVTAAKDLSSAALSGSLDDSIRLTDYSLIQAVEQLGFSAGSLVPFQTVRREKKTPQGAEAYPFQRVRLFSPLTPKAFTDSLERILMSRLGDASVRHVSRDGREVVRVFAGKTLTHEIFIMSSVRAPLDGLLPDTPRLSIIVGGLGREEDTIRALLGMEQPFAYAVAPDAPRSRECGRLISNKEATLLIQQWVDGSRGVYAVGRTTDAETMRRMLTAGVTEFPEAVGLYCRSNGKDLGIGAWPDTCQLLITEAARSGLSITDGVAAPTSVLAASAIEAGMTAWRRSVVADADGTDPVSIVANLQRAEALARKTGRAIVTLDATEDGVRALSEWLQKRDEAVRIVPLWSQPK